MSIQCCSHYLSSLSREKLHILHRYHSNMRLSLVLYSIICLLISGDNVWGEATKPKSKIIFACNPAVASLVRAVAGKDFSVISITVLTKSLHDIRLTPSMLRRLNQASLIFYTSRHMQPALHHVSRSSLSVQIVEIGMDQKFRQQLVHLGYYSSIPTNPDGHIWNMPTVSSLALNVIYHHLQHSFPQYSHIFKSNLAKAQCSLLELNRWMTNRMVGKCATTPFFAMHDSLRYLYKGLTLNFNRNLMSNTTQNLSPKSVSSLARIGKGHACVFVDHNHYEHAWRLLRNMHLENTELVSLDTDGIQVRNGGIEAFNLAFKEKIDIMCQCLCN